MYQAPFEPPDVFQFRDYPVPDVASGCLLIKMTLANICGSDMHGYLGESRNRDSTSPRHQGHEGTGHVAALGEGVTTDANGEPLAPGRPRDLRTLLLLWPLPSLRGRARNGAARPAATT